MMRPLTDKKRIISIVSTLLLNDLKQVLSAASV
jgi:hypothetical protein